MGLALSGPGLDQQPDMNWGGRGFSCPNSSELPREERDLFHPSTACRTQTPWVSFEGISPVMATVIAALQLFCKGAFPCSHVAKGRGRARLSLPLGRTNGRRWVGSFWMSFVACHPDLSFDHGQRISCKFCSMDHGTVEAHACFAETKAVPGSVVRICS